uniref:Uncharacterized protein n=1 Tax=Brassica oleracea TaxID=3712 RepID=A0A3P6D8L1_BRAOL|nr:unnamed protein product [Brassica oleracea]
MRPRCKTNWELYDKQKKQKLFCTSRNKPRRLKLQLMQPSMLNRKRQRTCLHGQCSRDLYQDSSWCS